MPFTDAEKSYAKIAYQNLETLISQRTKNEEKWGVWKGVPQKIELPTTKNFSDVHGLNTLDYAIISGDLELINTLIKDKYTQQDDYSKYTKFLAQKSANPEIISLFNATKYKADTKIEKYISNNFVKQSSLFYKSKENKMDINKDIDIGQVNLIKKFVHFLKLNNQPVPKEFEKGQCNGLTFLSIYYTERGKRHEFFKMLQLIAQWDGSYEGLQQKIEGISGFTENDNLGILINQFINDSIWYQQADVADELKIINPHHSDRLSQYQITKKDDRAFLLKDQIPLKADVSKEAFLQYINATIKARPMHCEISIFGPTAGHNTGLYISAEGKLYFYDPNDPHELEPITVDQLWNQLYLISLYLQHKDTAEINGMQFYFYQSIPENKVLDKATVDSLAQQKASFVENLRAIRLANSKTQEPKNIQAIIKTLSQTQLERILPDVISNGNLVVLTEILNSDKGKHIDPQVLVNALLNAKNPNTEIFDIFMTKINPDHLIQEMAGKPELLAKALTYHFNSKDPSLSNETIFVLEEKNKTILLDTLLKIPVDPNLLSSLSQDSLYYLLAKAMSQRNNELIEAILKPLEKDKAALKECLGYAIDQGDLKVISDIDRYCNLFYFAKLKHWQGYKSLVSDALASTTNSKVIDMLSGSFDPERALFVAIETANLVLLKKTITEKATIDENILDHAIEVGNVDVLNVLLKNTKVNIDESFINLAIEKRNIDILNTILEFTASQNQEVIGIDSLEIDMEDPEILTAILNYALKTNQMLPIDSIEPILALENKQILNIILDYTKKTSQIENLLASAQDTETINLLMPHVSDLRKTLSMAIENQNTEVVSAILDSKRILRLTFQRMLAEASVSSKDPEKYSDPKIIQFLITHPKTQHADVLKRVEDKEVEKMIKSHMQKQEALQTSQNPLQEQNTRRPASIAPGFKHATEIPPAPSQDQQLTQENKQNNNRSGPKQ